MFICYYNTRINNKVEIYIYILLQITKNNNIYISIFKYICDKYLFR